MSAAPRAILFACTLNAVRSPMAEGLARSMLGSKAYVASVGLAKTDVDPFAVAVMREIGIEIGEHEPRSFDDISPEAFDVIVALSDDAHTRAQRIARTASVVVEHWPTEDPTAVGQTREQRLAAYRQVRDALRRRIRTVFVEEPSPGTVRSDA